MKRLLKKIFPGLYDYYNHLQRVKAIRRISEQKKLSVLECAKQDAKLYEEKIGHKLHWDNLRTYTEKMQWEKIFDNNPQKAYLADKYAVREWVSRIIGDEYLIPLLGVWDSFDDIDFANLPARFVLKTNHGSGTNVIVKDKNSINMRQIRRLINDWLRIDYGYYTGFEMHYSRIQPKIIAEKYLETEIGELQDYKFICFNDEVYYCWVDLGRYSKHTRNVYDLNWNLQPWNQASYGIADHEIPKPKNFDKMIDIARKLCKGFSHVRVDLYNVDGTIYFGEMTFTNGSGLDAIIPSEYDLMLGQLWKIETPVPKELEIQKRD